MGFKQIDPNKFCVEFSGTNINLNNTIHRKFLEEILGKVASSISLFGELTKKYDCAGKSPIPTAKSLDDFLNEFTKQWKKN